MTVYQQVLLGSNLSQFASSIETQHEAIRSHERGSTEPTIKPAGLIWSCTNGTILNTLTATQVGGPWSEALARWDGSAWVLQGDPRYPAINAGGTVKMAAALLMNGQQIQGLAAGSSSGHVPRMDQCLLRDGSYAATADLNMGGFAISGLATPTLSGHATRKDYVDAQVAANSGVPDTGVADARGTQQAVTLGYQPSVVVIALVDADFGAGPFDLNRPSTSAVFTAGTGTETSTVIADLPNTQGGLVTIRVEVEFTATGFKVRTNEAFAPTDGTLKYAAWRPAP